LSVRIPAVLPPPSFVPLMLSGRNDPHGILIKRSVFDEVGGYESAAGNFCEDWSLYVKVALRYPIYIDDKATYWWRQHPDSYCRTLGRRGGTAAGHAEFWNWFERYLDEHGIKDRAVRRALMINRLRTRSEWSERAWKLAGKARRAWQAVVHRRLRSRGPTI
jgi:hypothetical protein